MATAPRTRPSSLGDESLGPPEMVCPWQHGSPGVSGWSLRPWSGDSQERLTQLSVGVPHPQCLAATSLGAVIFGRAHPLSPAPFTCSGSGVQGLPPAPTGCWLLCKGPPCSPSRLAAPRGCEQPHVDRLTACSPAVRSPDSGHIVTTPGCRCMPLPLSFPGPRFGVKALLISQSGARLL